MKTAIFIRSHAPDAIWLEWCLKSIKRFASGYEYVIVAVPSRDGAIFRPLTQKYGCRLFEYDVRPDKPFLSGEVQLCHADSICADVDSVALFDSDCMFREPWSPLDNLVNGKPVLLGQAYDKIDSVNRIWQERVANALGWTPTHEFMRHPTIFLCSTFAPFRDAVEKHVGKPFDEYVLSGRDTFPQDFAELSSLGAFAAFEFTKQYCVVDVHTIFANTKADSGSIVTAWKLRQFYSHGGINNTLRMEMEALLK